MFGLSLRIKDMPKEKKLREDYEEVVSSNKSAVAVGMMELDEVCPTCSVLLDAAWALAEYWQEEDLKK